MAEGCATCRDSEVEWTTEDCSGVGFEITTQA